MMTASLPFRVLITEAAAALLGQLRAQHGQVMFHQSGGCCDGSSPMCYPVGEFAVGDRDVLLGIFSVDGGETPVWISNTQFHAWSHTQLVIDVVPGRGAGFSLEAPRRSFVRETYCQSAGDMRICTALLHPANPFRSDDTHR